MSDTLRIVRLTFVTSRPSVKVVLQHRGTFARNAGSLVPRIALFVLSCFLVASGSHAAHAYPSDSSTEIAVKNCAQLPQKEGKIPALTLPHEVWVGDLDGMIKRRNIRALVVYSKSGFFYDQGRPEGIFYEAAHPTGGFYVKRDFILAEQCTARSELLTDV